MKEKTLGHIYALFTILVWGSCFVLTKVMLTAYTPTQIIPLRMGLAYLTLWALRPKTMKLPWKDELMFILIGITGGSFYFFLQNTAAAHTSAANVSILVSMSPILTVILAQLFSRKGEKLGEIRDYFGKSLFTELAPADGVLLYQTASLNIIEKGPMVSYGVPRPDP